MLNIQDLTINFGGLKAVNGFSMDVAAKEFVGVIGPNGAGKTTLMHLITGNLTPTSGDVRFEGASLIGRKPFEVCRLGIARTFQIVRPFGEMTVEDNVVTGALFSKGQRVSVAQARERAAEPLKLTGLWDQRHAPASSLTLGGKKKLELARALATGPRLLLLDEVMGGLARGDIDDLIEVLRRIHAGGVTIVMIEHLVEVILALSQRVVVLNFGEKLFEGAPNDVVNNPAVIESYLGRPLETAA